MLENYLVFSIANVEYATSLIKVPIVLIAKKYIGSTQLKDISEIRLPFEGAAIQLIDIANLLSLTPSKITLNSRLLVGQLEDNFFGFVVDDVREIIVIEDDDILYNKSQSNNAIESEVDIDGRKLKIIDVDKVLEILFNNETGDGE